MANTEKHDLGGHHYHHHDDHDHHNHGDNLSFSERNREHWDQKASTYMSDHFQKQFDNLLNKVTAFILTNISWLDVDFLDPAETFEASDDKHSRSVRVLDYACGPGTITSALAGYASEYVGIDLSEKMVAEYNKRLSSSPSVDRDHPQQHTSTQTINAKATVGNLLAPQGPPASLSGAEFTNFDLVAVGLGFHHFENLNEVMRRLTARLKPNGVIMIVDFLPHAKNDIDNGANADLIAHHGFTEDNVRSLFTGAGLVDVDLRVMREPVMMQGKAPRRVFIAKGRKVA